VTVITSRFSTYDELSSLLFGVYTRCDSAREVCDGMASLGGKLNYLGMDTAPAKSTFNDGLNRRDEAVFEKIYFALIDYFSLVLSASRKEDVRFDKFYAFDSTTISLFSEVNVSDKVGLNRAYNIYRPFVILNLTKVKKESGGWFAGLTLYDPSRAKTIFENEIWLNLMWDGWTDQGTMFPLFNSLLDYLREQK